MLEEIAAVEAEIAALRREITSFIEEMEEIKAQVVAIDSDYHAAQAEHHLLLRRLRAGDSLDQITAVTFVIQLACLVVYMGSLSTEISLEGQKVRAVSQRLFANASKVKYLERRRRELKDLVKCVKVSLEGAAEVGSGQEETEQVVVP